MAKKAARKKATKKTTKVVRKAKKKTKQTTKRVEAKVVGGLPDSYDSSFIENPACVRRKLNMFWRMPMGQLKAIAQDPNTPAHDVMLIAMVRKLVFSNDMQSFIFFLNLVFKGGTVPGLDFDIGDDSDDDNRSRGQVRLLLPANGSENLDHYSPKDLVEGVLSDD